MVRSGTKTLSSTWFDPHDRPWPPDETVVIGNHPKLASTGSTRGGIAISGQPDFPSRLLKHQRFVQTHFEMRRGVVGKFQEAVGAGNHHENLDFQEQTMVMVEGRSSESTCCTCQATLSTAPTVDLSVALILFRCGRDRRSPL